MSNMINLIPLSFLSKMGVYDIEIHGANVKVSVVDNLALVDAKINELKSSLQTSQRHVVGLDIKFALRNVDDEELFPAEDYSLEGKILLLCVGTDCLMIQLPASMEVTDTLRQFLSDETICFLGTQMQENVEELGRHYFSKHTQCVDCKTGVEVGYLAAKILKKGNVVKYGLSELAGEVGMDIKEPIGANPDWHAVAFSNEEVKYAVHNAYASYVIGNKLLDML
ncbi:uncharacterized protein LOC115981635 [Quercus lobata]|uniref:3'-5' exonuclease domain-containing protein n=1 Tax=Quercus lobata TaxID=97700 RepID=A0A7N2R0X1_QUELO|nr:uncharacterized protein LOC115981635 [Quercus lobata]